MIGFLRGNIVHISDENLLLDVNGVGYNIIITSRDAEALLAYGDEVTVYTYLSVREDAMKLHGFITREELEFFKLLICVKGIGPKGAQAMLAAMSVDEIRFAIIAGDAKTLSKCPGIGNKSAQQVILDLKDKVDLNDAFESAYSHNNGPEPLNKASGANDDKTMAIEAMTALGFSATEATKAVRSVNITEDMSVEDIIKQALKSIR